MNNVVIWIQIRDNVTLIFTPLIHYHTCAGMPIVYFSLFL